MAEKPNYEELEEKNKNFEKSIQEQKDNEVRLF